MAWYWHYLPYKTWTVIIKGIQSLWKIWEKSYVFPLYLYIFFNVTSKKWDVWLSNFNYLLNYIYLITYLYRSPSLKRLPILQWKSGLKRWVFSLKGDNLVHVVFYYLKCILNQAWHEGLPYKRGTAVVHILSTSLLNISLHYSNTWIFQS